jgi:hypothetical protein
VVRAAAMWRAVAAGSRADDAAADVAADELYNTGQFDKLYNTGRGLHSFTFQLNLSRF